MSETSTLKLALAVRPALLVAVTVCAPGVAAPGVQLYVRVAPLPDLDQPLPNDAAAGKVYDPIAESPSVELAVRSKLPLPVGRKKAVSPTDDTLPTKFENEKVGALGSDVSTFTVAVTDVVLPTLSVPVSV